uniref:WGS project CBMI000000000 data, contig CS3069_c003880 n=1 Tax=Fusarium clavum TaxID=2594811 RepID=A0A090MIB6_9HYPO|nr:unnamed protein product [Fusarium clavum]
MASSIFLTGALVVAGFRAVIASPCRPSPQVTFSSETVVSLSTTLETLLASTSNLETSTTQEVYFSEIATSLLSTSFVAESFSSISSSVFETGTDSTGLSSTTKPFATETGTTTAVTSEEYTRITTATSETTTWYISETVTNAETEVTTLATTETTDEPTTALLSQTTTDETLASTTEFTLPPVPTFELVARSQSVGEVVMYASSNQVRVSTSPFSAPFTTSISYEENTEHIMVNNIPLCVWYSSHGRMAPLEPCKSVAPESQRPLTCEKPTAAGLKCHVPARACNGESCTELGYDWDKFYLLDMEDGVFVVVLGADDLTTERDARQGLEPIGMDIRAAK